MVGVAGVPSSPRSWTSRPDGATWSTAESGCGVSRPKVHPTVRARGVSLSMEPSTLPIAGLAADRHAVGNPGGPTGPQSGSPRSLEDQSLYGRRGAVRTGVGLAIASREAARVRRESPASSPPPCAGGRLALAVKDLKRSEFAGAIESLKTPAHPNRAGASAKQAPEFVASHVPRASASTLRDHQPRVDEPAQVVAGGRCGHVRFGRIGRAVDSIEEVLLERDRQPLGPAAPLDQPLGRAPTMAESPRPARPAHPRCRTAKVNDERHVVRMAHFTNVRS